MKRKASFYISPFIVSSHVSALVKLVRSSSGQTCLPAGCYVYCFHPWYPTLRRDRWLINTNINKIEEQIPYYTVLFFPHTDCLFYTNKAAVSPTGEANEGPYLPCLCDHTASFSLSWLALNRKEARRVLSVKRCAITLSFTGSGFVVSHPMTVR